MQEFLQHLFGFIGICTVVQWTIKFCKPKPKESPVKLNCPNCGCTDFSLLRSINTKKCIGCGHEIEWHLDEGQLPLICNNRMVKRNGNNVNSGTEK